MAERFIAHDYAWPSDDSYLWTLSGQNRCALCFVNVLSYCKHGCMRSSSKTGVLAMLLH